jgi:hypothetical protein
VGGLDGDEHLIVVEAAKPVGERLQDGRLIADLVEQQGTDDGRSRRRRRCRRARSGGAGIEQGCQGDAPANAKPETQPAIEEGTTGVKARHNNRRVGHVLVRLSAVC